MTIQPNSVSTIQVIRQSAGPSKRIVFVSGTFNIVHPGHLRLLRFASECGDFLVVGVFNDKLADNAQLNQEMRLEGVAAISWVGHAFLLNDAPENFIAELQPAVVVKGKEHENGNNPEHSIVKTYGGKLVFGSGDTTFSSLELIRKETEFINHSSIISPKEFLNRHDINIFGFKSVLEKMRSLKVCVIGDTVMDEYIQCDPLGMSQEDPTIVVAPIVAEKFLGAAAVVAAHARSIGAKSVSFVSVTGDDDTGRHVAEKLNLYGVNACLLRDDSRPTTLKQRYRAGNKTLLRVSHLRQHKINKMLQQQVFERAMEALVEANLLIFADFNYGVLPQDLVNKISNECLRRNVMIIADSQCSSQSGDVSRFKNATLITPTEREARIALGNYEDGLVVVAEALRKRTNSENIAITLGAEGLLIHAKATGKGEWLTDRLPALNTAPKDTAGAGDCLLVCAAMALASGRSIWESLYLGSVAAACQVGRIGNTPLTATELLVETNKSNNFN